MRDRVRLVREDSREATGRNSDITAGFCITELVTPAALVNSNRRDSTLLAPPQQPAGQAVQRPVRSRPAPRIMVAMMLITVAGEAAEQVLARHQPGQPQHHQHDQRDHVGTHALEQRNMAIVKPTSPSTSSMSVVSVGCPSGGFDSASRSAWVSSGRTAGPRRRGPDAAGRAPRNAFRPPVGAGRCRAGRRSLAMPG